MASLLSAYPSGAEEKTGGLVGATGNAVNNVLGVDAHGIPNVAKPLKEVPIIGKPMTHAAAETPRYAAQRVEAGQPGIDRTERARYQADGDEAKMLWAEGERQVLVLRRRAASVHEC